MKTLRVSALCLLLCVSGAAASDERLDDLSAEHRGWLEEQVPYVILERERDVFLSLETLEERERFIEAFWRRRDPSPNTPHNELREEHYRRLAYANEVIGRTSAAPGWRTDRGRMYVILGEPASVERFRGYNEIVSSELWFYESERDSGLPPFFYLVFYRPYNVGDFQLYNPVVHGPTALLSPQFIPTVDGHQALEILDRVSPELRRASLSLDPAEPGGLEGAALGSQVLLAKIEDAPKRRASADYTDAWLRYGGLVEAEYSFNFVPNRSRFVILRGRDGTAFVHYTIELDPKDFAVETDESQSKFYTTLDVELEVNDLDGRLVASSENELYLELTPAEMERILDVPVAYQDDFPLVPGRYRASVLLKNRVLKRFTVAERELMVEALPKEGPRIGGLALGYHAETVSDVASKDEVRTFQLGELLLHPAADGVFVLGDTVHVLVQVLRAPPDQELRFRLRDDTRIVQERSTRLSQYHGAAALELFPLRDMVGGNYVMEVDLIGPDGESQDHLARPLQVSPRSEWRRPWTYRRSFDSRKPGSVALALARQHLARNEFNEAKTMLERVAGLPDHPPAADWLLAGLLIQSGEDERALSILRPLEPEWPEQFEVIAGLGSVYYLRGEWAHAAEYLQRAVGIRPPDSAVLNALGDSYRRLGDVQRARAAYERSLRVRPDQDEIRDRLAAMSGKDSETRKER